MALESATYITDLVSTNPLGSDGKDKGDDHIRLIKATLAATFAGFTGAAMNATEAELNILNGATLTTAELNKLDGSGLIGSVLDFQTDSSSVNSVTFDYNTSTKVLAITTT